jgi:hypothetical protein
VELGFWVSSGSVFDEGLNVHVCDWESFSGDVKKPTLQCLF